MNVSYLVHFLKFGIEIDERALQVDAAVIFVDWDFQCSELLYALREEIGGRSVERSQPVAIDASCRKSGGTAVAEFVPDKEHRGFQRLELVGVGLLNMFRHPFHRQNFVLYLAQRVYKQNELFSILVFAHKSNHIDNELTEKVVGEVFVFHADALCQVIVVFGFYTCVIFTVW